MEFTGGWEFAGPIETLFKSGDEASDDPSTLHHLRLDLVQLYGPETDFGGKTQVPFLTAQGVLSGVDLLGQIYVGPGGRENFKSVLIDLGGLAELEAEALYQLRCFLSHSADLEGSAKQGPHQGEEFTSLLTDDKGPRAVLVKNIGTTQGGKPKYESTVYLKELKRLFLRCCDELRDRCNPGFDPKKFPPEKRSELLNRVGKAHVKRIVEVKKSN